MNELPAIEQRAIPLVARNDIEVQRLIFRGEPIHVLKDPLALTYSHLRPAQFLLWRHLDGNRSADEIRGFLVQKFPTLTIRASDVQQLATDLHSKGLTRSLRFNQAKRLRRRYWESWKQKAIQTCSSPFFIRFPPFNPNRLVSVGSIFLGWLFSKWGASFALVVIVASWLEAAIRWQSISGDLPSLQAFFGWPNLLWLWMMIGVTKLIHELGHAIACKRMGQRCHGIGAALLVFSPTLYCDATDSWMCQNKWHRIFVASAGMYVELFVGAVAVFVWSHTHAGVLHSMALNVAAVSTVSTVLFNANPLIRFDGYYILSDAIEIPNLQEKSSRLLYRFFAWCLGITVRPNPDDPKTGRVWFVTYAVLSWCYRWFIMVVILWTIYAMLRPYRVESLGGIWVAVVAGMTAVGIFRSWKNIVATKVENQFSKRRLVNTCLVASIVAVVVCFVPVPWWRTTPLICERAEPTTAYNVMEGRIKKVVAKPGHRVVKGDLLLILENSDIDDELRTLQQDQQRIAAEIESLELLQEHADLILKQQELSRTIRRLEELSPLQKSLEIRAPSDGLLLPGPYLPPAPSNGDRLSTYSEWALAQHNVGAWIPSGTPLASIGTELDCVAVLYVEQDTLEELAAEQSLRIQFDALPHKIVSSHIKRISADHNESIPPALSQRFGGRLPTESRPDGEEIAASKVYQLIATLPKDPAIRPGMRGRARLSLSRKTVLQRFVQLIRNTFYFRL